MTYNSLLEAFDSLNIRKHEDPQSLSGDERQDWKTLRNQIEHILFQQSPEPEADRREFIRVPSTFSARYWTSHELKDRYIPVMGEGGLFISTISPLPVGEKIDIEIVLAEKRFSFNVTGEVVWINTGKRLEKQGMGIKFIDLSYDQKATIYNLVNDCVRGRLLERRQYSRLDSQLAVQFLSQEGSFELPTADLSADGMFVASEVLLDEGERLKATLQVPGTSDPVRIVAKVIRSEETPAPGLPVGIGLHFLMIDEKGKQAILDYMVKKVANPQDKSKSVDEHRFHPRIKRRIKVKYTSADQAGTSYCRDISRNGVFIQTHEPPVIDSNLAVTIEHPTTRQLLPLSGKIVRVVHPDPSRPHVMPGAGVIFSKISETKEKILTEFLKEFVLLEGPPTHPGKN